LRSTPLASILVLISILAIKGTFIVIPSVGDQGDLVISVDESFDEAEAFVFSVNQTRDADIDLLRNESEAGSRSG
jgi:hypothetical protein